MKEAAALGPIRSAPVGVFAYRNGDRPVAITVTPFANRDGGVVTATLALVRKMELLRADPRCSLLAGGVSIAGLATVTVDRRGERFRRELLAEEKLKYPPTAQLAAIPFSRWLLWWYFGRVIADIAVVESRAVTGSDRTTLTTLDRRGFPTISLVGDRLDLHSERIAVPGEHQGPAVLHLHEEHDSGADLRQLTLHGRLENGVLHVDRRVGSLDPAARGVGGQIRTLLNLRRLARRARPRVRALERGLLGAAAQ